MDKELTELFESVKRAAELAENSPEEEDRCLDALKQLMKFPVNYQVLVSTQVGKRLRQLTKHRSKKIKALASDVIGIWKTVIVKETTKNKKNGTTDNDDPATAKSTCTKTDAVNIQMINSIKTEQKSTPKNMKLESSIPSGKPNSVEATKPEVVEKTRNAFSHVDKKVKVEIAISEPASAPKLGTLVYCKDSLRDKVREILAEALCKVSSEVDDDLRDKVNKCDPNRVAVLVETAMFENWGKSNGAQKAKYRSILFNIKDSNNPDFRRKVLIGDFEPHDVVELRVDEMASDARQVQNEKIKQKALFNSERGGAPQASTDQFTCGRCKKKETTYYQMQTRSADEPMTTFVTCVNCNNRWKFC